VRKWIWGTGLRAWGNGILGFIRLVLYTCIDLKRTLSNGMNFFYDEKKYRKVLLIPMIAVTIIFADAPAMYEDGGTFRSDFRGVADARLLNNNTDFSIG
jgi:hypothetical protein